MITLLALSLQDARQLDLGPDIWDMVASQLSDLIFDGWEPKLGEPNDADFVPEMCRN